MKKILLITAVLFTLNTQAQLKEATLQAAGLTCAMCSNAINKALQRLPFASKVTSSIKESSFTITFKQNAGVDFDAIRKAVEDAGFSVASFRFKGKFDGVQVSNDAHIKLQGKNLHFLNIKPQTLSGEHTFMVVDRKFVSDKVYKKYAAYTKMECMKTGVMEGCCTQKKNNGAARIYHITI